MKKTSGCRWKRVEASYYKWNEVYKFYIEHCDKVEKSLAETLKLSYEDF